MHMEINNNGTRYNNYILWENRKHMPYDYARDGLLNKVLSNKIYNNKNIILKNILNIYEVTIVNILKTVDILNNYKNFLYRNR